MEITVNGEKVQLPEGKDGLLDLFTVVGIAHTQSGIAVAVNMELVPRSEWAEKQLAAGDAVEIITARQGG
jgi:sulfur carrier protein